jgi:hypothetical protein
VCSGGAPQLLDFTENGKKRETVEDRTKHKKDEQRRRDGKETLQDTVITFFN